MSMKILGPCFDLHLGGEDLVFPHHEDEIAQSEGSREQHDHCRFVKHWVHVAHLLVEGRKMSKSLGNYFTLRDLLAKGFSGREIRFLLLSSHYRESFNFTFDGLSGARNALGRLDEMLSKLRELSGGKSAAPDQNLIDRFTEAMDEDLNVAGAWGHIFEWVRATNRSIAENRLSTDNAAAALAAWERIDSVLGVSNKPADSEAPREIQQLLEERQAARKAKNFAQADALRDQLKAQGWAIEDTPKGPKLKKL
jgi:cysteinyl-tRNA synthetase